MKGSIAKMTGDVMANMALMNVAHQDALQMIQGGESLLTAVEQVVLAGALTPAQREVLLCSQVLNEAHPVPGTICYRKRRGRKMHFMVAGPTFVTAKNYIAWDRIERRASGETVYQYFWCGNGEVKEITQ